MADTNKVNLIDALDHLWVAIKSVEAFDTEVKPIVFKDLLSLKSRLHSERNRVRKITPVVTEKTK